MTVTRADLAARIGKPDTSAFDRPFATAQKLLGVPPTYAGGAFEGAFREVPGEVYDECLLSVGYALWDRTKSSNGMNQQIVPEGSQSVRAPRDPLASIRSILANYVVEL